MTPPDGPEPARRLARCSTWHFTGRAAGLLREMADWIDAHPTDLVLGLTLILDITVVFYMGGIVFVLLLILLVLSRRRGADGLG